MKPTTAKRVVRHKTRNAALPGNVPFHKAIKRITRKTTEGKALPALKAFLHADITKLLKASLWASDSDSVEKAVEAQIKTWRRDGFTPDGIDGMAKKYASLPRRAPRTPKK